MGEKKSRRKLRTLTEDEARLWEDIARTISPMPGRMPFSISDSLEDRPLPACMPDPEPKSRSSAPVPNRTSPLSRRKVPFPPLDTGQSPGVDRRTALKFRRGKMTVDARIDLHGMGKDTAHANLLSFLGRSLDNGCRCVLVITGKGTRGEGILRRALPHWLNDSRIRPHILSFSVARLEHGGEGAFYVLLRRTRR